MDSEDKNLSKDNAELIKRMFQICLSYDSLSFAKDEVEMRKQEFEMKMQNMKEYCCTKFAETILEQQQQQQQQSNDDEENLRSNDGDDGDQSTVSGKKRVRVSDVVFKENPAMALQPTSKLAFTTDNTVDNITTAGSSSSSSSSTGAGGGNNSFRMKKISKILNKFNDVYESVMFLLMKLATESSDSESTVSVSSESITGSESD